MISVLCSGYIYTQNDRLVHSADHGTGKGSGEIWLTVVIKAAVIRTWLLLSQWRSSRHIVRAIRRANAAKTKEEPSVRENKEEELEEELNHHNNEIFLNWMVPPGAAHIELELSLFSDSSLQLLLKETPNSPELENCVYDPNSHITIHELHRVWFSLGPLV